MEAFFSRDVSVAKTAGKRIRADCYTNILAKERAK
jgi:hypothetical protein